MSAASRRPPRDRRPAARGGARSSPGRSGRGSTQGRGRSKSGIELGGDQVEGRRAVLELLRAGQRSPARVLMATELDPSEQLDQIEALCQKRRVPIEHVSRSRLDRVAATESHQGVLAKAPPLVALDLDELLDPERRGSPFLLVCDGLTDPHNLGSLLRSAESAGVTGIVLPRHRSVRISPTVAKVAAGAIEHLRFALVPGIPAALDRLGKAGVLTVGLAGEVRTSIYDLDLSASAVALVVGSEDKGLAALSRKRCDVMASIPQAGEIESLNASVAGAVALFEAARQRR